MQGVIIHPIARPLIAGLALLARRTAGGMGPDPVETSSAGMCRGMAPDVDGSVPGAAGLHRQGV